MVTDTRKVAVIANTDDWIERAIGDVTARSIEAVEVVRFSRQDPEAKRVSLPGELNAVIFCTSEGQFDGRTRPSFGAVYLGGQLVLLPHPLPPKSGLYCKLPDSSIPSYWISDAAARGVVEIAYGSGKLLGAPLLEDGIAYVRLDRTFDVALFLRGKPLRGVLLPDWAHLPTHVRLLDHNKKEWVSQCPDHRNCIVGLAGLKALEQRAGSDDLRTMLSFSNENLIGNCISPLFAAIMSAGWRHIIVGGALSRLVGEIAMGTQALIKNTVGEADRDQRNFLMLKPASVPEHEAHLYGAIEATRLALFDLPLETVSTAEKL